jgi:hypothetical protein
MGEDEARDDKQQEEARPPLPSSCAAPVISAPQQRDSLSHITSVDVMQKPYSTNSNAAMTAEMAPAEMITTGSRRSGAAEEEKANRRRRSSIELRKVPTDILLRPSGRFSAIRLNGGDDAHNDLEDEDMVLKENESSSPSNRKLPPASLFKKMCINPRYSLRRQLMLSFGSVSALTIVFVVVICILITYMEGEHVKTINQKSFEELARNSQGTTARYLSESLEQRLPVDLVQILYEATLDRFQGYNPYDDQQENEDDSKVPFRDAITGERVYPIVGDPMPLDWEIIANVHGDNFQEHVQSSRWDFYQSKTVSTANAVFHMQGTCDPTELDLKSRLYWPNCTAANNDMSTGGVERPVPSAAAIHRKGSDLVPLIKAIFEANEEVRDLGLFFKSMGAGASLSYPAVPISSHTNYTSIGCDWMKTPNPYDPSRPIGTQDEIDRCHKADEVVSNRVYNPLERGWCRDQALQPEKVFVDSYIDVWSSILVLSLGRAVYDRQTKDFVACIYIGIDLSLIEERLAESRVTKNSEVSVVRFDKDGTVMASSAAISATSGETDKDVFFIHDLHVGVTQESYRALYGLVDYESSERWDPHKVRDAYEAFTVRDHGFWVATYLVPPVPDEYNAEYQPEFLVIMSMAEEDMYSGVNDVNDDVDNQVEKVARFALIVGAVGLAVATLIIFLMSNTLTAPLRYMNQEADEIVNNFGASSSMENKTPIAPGDKELSTFEGSCRNGPRTELSEVVMEFNKMVTNFSGSMLERTENGTRVEVRNPFDMREEFKELYLSRKKSTFAYDITAEAEEVGESNGSISDGGDKGTCGGETLGFIHIESNLRSSGTVNGSRGNMTSPTGKPQPKGFRSPLFLWTVALIVTPLLLTTITISAVVMNTVSDEFKRSVENAEDYFIDVKLVSLKVHATLRAEFVASLTAVSVRDLYFLTRYYGWLLFGGLRRADSFTELTTGIEECKIYSDDYTKCPFVQENSLCDCAWNDQLFETCENYPDGSRHLQISSFFNVESNDALPDGDRNVSSFPSLSYSPATTAWWDDATQVPGWEKGSSAAGYETLYDRLRVSSAMPLYPVLYNYDIQKENYVGQYVSFEADGLLLGYMGCRYALESVDYSNWQSTESNGAASLRPELCAMGKHGFDPR